jgi:hypothetical protein
MVQVEGKVEKNDIQSGTVTINGIGYAATEQTRMYAAKLEEGKHVKLSANEKNQILFIWPTPSAPPTSTTSVDSSTATVTPTEKIMVSVKDHYIIRQNALAHADANAQYIRDTFNTQAYEQAYFAFAERVEKWVLR